MYSLPSLKKIILLYNNDLLQFDSGEQRHLNELLTQSSSESTVPYLVGLAEFLSKTIPIISSSFELLFDKYRLIQTRSVDVVPKGHRSNVTSINDNVPNTRSPNSIISGIDNTGDSIVDDLRESLVDTTLSILQMLLLSFIFSYLIRMGLTPD